MTIDCLLSQLDAVRRSRRGWVGRCPAHHPDRNPSLSIAEGQRGLLLRCWAGCRIQDITAALGLTLRDLFYDQGQDFHKWSVSQRKRKAERARREDHDYVLGLLIDSRREADWLLASARNPGLIGWNEGELHEALNVVADAQEICLTEKVEHGDDPF